MVMSATIETASAAGFGFGKKDKEAKSVSGAHVSGKHDAKVSGKQVSGKHAKKGEVQSELMKKVNDAMSP